MKHASAQKRLLRFAASVLVLLALLPLFASADEFEQFGVKINDYDIHIDTDLNIRSGNVLMYCADTGKYLYKKNDTEPVHPSAAVKLMVGVVAMELYGDRLDEPVTVTKSLLSGSEGISIFLEEGEVITYRELIYAVLIRGANDAATILARSYNGGIDDFVLKMNEKAKQIGAKDTVFKNITGLNAQGARTTLYDVIKIARYAAELEGFTNITKIDRYVLGDRENLQRRVLINRNSLVCKYYTTEYFSLHATGLAYAAAGSGEECLIVSAKIDGLSYYIALYGGTSGQDADGNTINQTVFMDANTLMAYAKDAYGYIDVVSTKTGVCELPVEYSTKSDHVMLVPSQDVTLYLPSALTKKDLTEKVIVYEEKLYAPVQKGDQAGELVLYYQDTELCRVSLVTKSSVTQNRILFILAQIQKITSTRIFIISAAALVVLLILYVFISAAVRGTQQKRKKNYYR